MTEYRESKSGLIVASNKPACAKCFICGYEAVTPRDMERHVVRCSDEHAETFRAAHSPKRGPHDPEIWDVEYERYMRWGGRKEAHRKWDPWFREHDIDPALFDSDRTKRRPTR